MTVAPQVAVLIVTHGGAAAAMRAALETLVGPAAVRGIAVLTVAPREPRASLLERASEALARLDQGAGVLVVCDLFGATPMNCVMELKRDGRRLEVLGGVNLPMLVKLATVDRTAATVAELARLAAETAIRSIRLGEGEAT
jgi:mannose/fructose-specific phosphotransferase system component IIA